MRVAAYQAPYRLFPAPLDADLVVPYVQRAHDAGVEILVCPEAVIGELANESDGDDPATVALSAFSQELRAAITPLLGWDMSIVVGFTERGAGGAIHNSAAVIQGDDILGIYRKTYPGTSKCVAGTELPVFHHNDITFGVLICNDAHYIEPARVLAAKGAQLLAIPVHGGHRPAKEHQWRARGNNVLIARAVENSIAVVAADIAGHQGERLSYGTTAIIDTQGSVIASATELLEDLVIADLDYDGPRGGMDGNLFGHSNPAVTAEFRAFWPQ